MRTYELIFALAPVSRRMLVTYVSLTSASVNGACRTIMVSIRARARRRLGVSSVIGVDIGVRHGVPPKMPWLLKNNRTSLSQARIDCQCAGC